jgi:hypothetical protein
VNFDRRTAVEQANAAFAGRYLSHPTDAAFGGRVHPRFERILTVGRVRGDLRPYGWSQQRRNTDVMRPRPDLLAAPAVEVTTEGQPAGIDDYPREALIRAR